jgi:hypothetical protein
MARVIRLLRIAGCLLVLAAGGRALPAQVGPGYGPPPAPGASGPSVRVGGYIQARETWRDDTKLTATLNRARIFAEGGLAAGFAYRIMAEYQSGGNASTAATVALRDAYIRWTRSDLVILAGQYKTPFSPEYITSITQIETADRSTVVDSLATKRDIGVMAQYTYRNYVTLSGGIFNGEGQNRIVNVDSSSLVVGRVAVRPMSFVVLGSNVAAYGSDSTRWGLDLDVEYRGATLKGEYLWQDHHVDRPVDQGWYGLATYRVLPWVQLVIKQEKFERDALSLSRRVVATTGGVNVQLAAARIRLLANYVSRRIGSPGVRRGTLITQAQVRF